MWINILRSKYKRLLAVKHLEGGGGGRLDALGQISVC